MNLDLMLDYGAESWKQYNEVLQDMLNRIQVRVEPGNTKSANYNFPWFRLSWQK